MTAPIPPPSIAPLALLFTLYTRFDIEGGAGQTTNITLPLRNLTDDPAAQVKQACQLMDEVAADLHHLTGVGVDRGRVRQGSTTRAEQSYATLTPYANEGQFHCALTLSVPHSLCYLWLRDGKQRSLPPEDAGWARTTTHTKGVSLRLPVVVLNSRDRLRAGCQPFFTQIQKLRRKRARMSYGFRVSYDQADPVWQRFIQRFYPEGNLGIGSRGCFLPTGGSFKLEGRWWPEAKAKSDEPRSAPRLASQPTDATEWVYVIQAGRQLVFKIGISNDPKRRLAQLQTAQPQKLRLVHQFQADNASAAEYALHQALHTQRMEGEWFRLTSAQKEGLLSVTAYQEQGFQTAAGALSAAALLGTG